jgi:hypothetical protein
MANLLPINSLNAALGINGTSYAYSNTNSYINSYLSKLG